MHSVAKILHHSFIYNAAMSETPASKPAFDHKAFLKTVTSKPGVYRMFDADDAVLYIGKAKNLKNRLSSYFRNTAVSVKTAVMLSHTRRIDVTVTHTEGEALILESNLIKEFSPRYNVLMRDDKSYPYIFVSDKQTFPGFEVHRGSRARPGRYLGPYPNAGAVRESIHLLQSMFLIRSCEDSVFKNRSRPCLQYQIKRCSAPCVGYISAAAYQSDLRHALLFLEGKSNEIIHDLVSAMEKASSRHHYEKAALYRDQIKRLQVIAERQHISADKGDIDIVACASEGGQACVQVFFVRKGLNLGNRSYYPKLPDTLSGEEILAAFIPQFYLSREVPAEIIVSHTPQDADLIAQVLSETAGHKVSLRSQVRAERGRWLEMAIHNARHALSARLLSRSGLNKRFENLQQVLDLEEMPLRLECFDISHTQGEATIAACVVFTPEGSYKTDYRRYNIKDIRAGDDYAAMKQALTRRFRKAQEDARLPAVLFIDGGKGQLTQAVAVMQALNLHQIMLVGVAKGEGRKAGLEKLVFSDGRAELYLGIDSPALNLIMQVRDEAHRFAISGHRAQRAKTRRESPLETIPGLGPKRRQTLLKHYGGLQGITRAGVEDIAKIPGINQKLAQSIYDRFHES